jgi:hypothetical protein
MLYPACPAKLIYQCRRIEFTSVIDLSMKAGYGRFFNEQFTMYNLQLFCEMLHPACPDACNQKYNN